ncbi:MAG: WGR domain-containing protein [Deltaproteobacteria bacterium]|nr:MAG: WGR domain-containing protein [Deltaproteobacteria bacterium]
MSRITTWKLSDPYQPSFAAQYEVVQRAVLQVTDIKTNRNKYYALELHEGKDNSEEFPYRLFTHYGRTDDLENNPDSGQKECRYYPSLHQAQAGYNKIYRQKTSSNKGYKEVSLASCKIGSVVARGESSGTMDAKTLERIEVDPVSAQQEQTEQPSIQLNKNVRSLVRYLYDEAVGALTSRVNAKVTAHGIETPLGVLTIGQIEKGEEILADLYDVLQKKRVRRREDKLRELSSDFYTVIPHRFGRSRAAAESAVISSLSDFQTKQETLQLMKDMLQVNGEDGVVLHNAQEEQEYLALHCNIEALNHRSKRFKTIQRLVERSQLHRHNLRVHNVFAVERDGEESQFSEELDNQRLLFHGSRIQNWVGILSRGLLLPKIAVNMGATRTDEGWLGHGLYFSDASCTSSGYASEGSKGTGFMAVAHVALGAIKPYHKITYGLTQPPQGFDSCHGVRGTQFYDDEFVIYNERQQKLAYLVEFSE